MGLRVGFGNLVGNGMGWEGEVGLGLIVGFGMGPETLTSLAWGNNLKGSSLVARYTPPAIPPSRIKRTINCIAPLWFNLGM